MVSLRGAGRKAQDDYWKGELKTGSEGQPRVLPRGGGTCSSTDRINAFTGPVHESLTPWKHQSTSPPFEKMVKKSSMTEAGEDLGPKPAPGTRAASAAASCCAKRGTRHTKQPPETGSAALPLRAAGVPPPPRPGRAGLT